MWNERTYISISKTNVLSITTVSSSRYLLWFFAIIFPCAPSQRVFSRAFLPYSVESSDLFAAKRTVIDLWTTRLSLRIANRFFRNNAGWTLLAAKNSFRFRRINTIRCYSVPDFGDRAKTRYDFRSIQKYDTCKLSTRFTLLQRYFNASSSLINRIRTVSENYYYRLNNPPVSTPAWMTTLLLDTYDTQCLQSRTNK